MKTGLIFLDLFKFSSEKKMVLNVFIVYNIFRFEGHWKSLYVLGLSNEMPISSPIFRVTSCCLGFKFFHVINVTKLSALTSVICSNGGVLRLLGLQF